LSLFQRCTAERITLAVPKTDIGPGVCKLWVQGLPPSPPSVPLSGLVFARAGGRYTVDFVLLRSACEALLAVRHPWGKNVVGQIM